MITGAGSCQVRCAKIVGFRALEHADSEIYIGKTLPDQFPDNFDNLTHLSQLSNLFPLVYPPII